MSESTVAVVGSGIVGTTIAYLLSRQGHDVTIFEKGPEYPYPHARQFRERKLYDHWPAGYTLPPDLKNHTRSGDYPADLDSERGMVVGGSATHWGAVTLRMTPPDFKTQSRYRYGADWPLAYDDLEPYYCDAEQFLGVSGTDTDNPFAPRRSKPHPLPPFELGYDDRVLAERLRRHGIVIHTASQARTRHAYEKRPGCMNFGTCEVCPIGARYSPSYHLLQAVETGRCRILANTSVRRVVADKSGRARALVHRPGNGATESEHAAKVIIIAAGAIESARLLLLSSRERNTDGLWLGTNVGQHLMFHHIWQGRLHYREAFRPGSVGAVTGQCHQFLDPPSRGKHGGIKIDFSSDDVILPEDYLLEQKTAAEVVETYRQMRHWRAVFLQGETMPGAKKYVSLSDQRDRFGDPFAHVQYESSDFDLETYRFAGQLFRRFAAATGADDIQFVNVHRYDSGAHHAGTCRMGVDPRDSVVDTFGRVHGSPNLFAAGGSIMPSMGALQPTLTMAALAVRTARYLLAQGW